jgi:HlyD family secretion protein
VKASFLRRLFWPALAILIVLGGAGIVFAVQSWQPDKDDGVPTTRVTRGDLKLDVHANGELRAGRSLSLIAPPITGGSLRIVQLSATGTAVKTGDVIIEFDPAEQQYLLEQSRSELQEAEQEIVKMKADAAVQAASAKVALLTARFDVRRAELDVSAGELISAVEAKKRALNLEEAKRRLAQLEEDVRSRSVTSAAGLAALQEKRNKALIAMDRAKATIETLVMRSPMDGLVALRTNPDASGGFGFPGMVLPEYRVGDTVNPGRALADVLEAGQMQIRARVNENDRANLAIGQTAAIRVEAAPGRLFNGKIVSLGALASRVNFWESSQAGRQFDVFFQIDDRDARLRPGGSVRIIVAGRAVENALQLPRQAVFAKEGKAVVYVRDNNDRFAPREVKVSHRSENRVAVEGLEEGAEVALVDPEAAPAPSGGAPRPAPAAPTGAAR